MEVVNLAKYQEWLEPDGLIRLEGWARDGLTEQQIAHNMGCGLSTLKEWKNKFPAIATALKKGKEVVDYEVENALLKAAMEGNVTAQIYWLKNRKPRKWRDKPDESEKVGTGRESDQLSKSLEELAKGLESD